MIESLLEICGQAAIYFDPLSIDSMAQAVSNFNPNGKGSADLIQRGITQFDKFDKAWEELCRQYMKVLSNH